MTNDDKEIIINAIDVIESKRLYVLQSFLDLLFWKNYTEGYINGQDKTEIIKLLDTADVRGPDDESYIVWDTKHGLNVANAIRKKIGLPKLVRGVNEQLREVDTKRR